MATGTRRRLLGRKTLLLLAAGSVFTLIAVVACIQLGPPTLDKAFSGRPLPLERLVALPDGSALTLGECGRRDGPLVLFVHGTPGSWRDFSHVMADPELAARALLVSVDRLGWGGSAEDGIEPSLRLQAAALRAVLESYPDNLPAVVVGHSLGAPVAARLAMDAPQLVGALLLVAGSIDPELEETTWYQSLGRTLLIRPLVPDMLTRADDEIRPLRGELEKMLPLWSALTLPVFVLHGEDDGLVPIENVDFARRVLTNANLHVERIPDQGHLIPWQRPERIVALVESALDHE